VSNLKEGNIYSKLPINEFYSREVYVISPNDNLSYARKLMFKKGISRQVVLENDKIVGIISLRDIAMVLTKLGSEFPNTLSEITVKKAMRNKVFTLNSNVSVKDACNLMHKEKIGSVVAVSEDNLNGIFSKTDACKVFREYPMDEIKVRDAMHTNFAKVNLLSSFYRIVEKFLEGYDIVIVEDNGIPVGVITLSKIATMDENDLLKTKSAFLRGNEEITKVKVGHVAQRLMYRIDIGVSHNDKLFKAVNFILDYNLPALPVIDETGGLIGVISKNDIVRIIGTS